MSGPSAAIVLAAGVGTRMASDLPKLLHPVAGRAMVLRVLDALAGADADPVVVVIGHEAERVSGAVLSGATDPDRLIFATQVAQLGTGDAAGAGLSALEDPLNDASGVSDVLVLPGDAPLLRPATLSRLVSERRRVDAAASVLTTQLDDPTGYGRIVRSGGSVKIVEQRDAAPSVAQINEVNAGVYCFETAQLRWALGELRPVNAQSEYYLTDAIGLLCGIGQLVTTFAADPTEAMGVNDAEQLAACEDALAARYRR